MRSSRSVSIHTDPSVLIVILFKTDFLIFYLIFSLVYRMIMVIVGLFIFFVGILLFITTDKIVWWAEIVVQITTAFHIVSHMIWLRLAFGSIGTNMFSFNFFDSARCDLIQKLDNFVVAILVVIIIWGTVGGKEILNSELVRVVKAVHLVKWPIFVRANHFKRLSTLPQCNPILW